MLLSRLGSGLVLSYDVFRGDFQELCVSFHAGLNYSDPVPTLWPEHIEHLLVAF